MHPHMHTAAMDTHDAHQPRRALVLYGSQTGNAQDVAHEMARLAERLRFDSTLADLNAISLVCQARAALGTAGGGH